MNKQLPPPAGGPDLAALLRSRHTRTDDVPPPAPVTPPTPPRSAPEAAQRPARSQGQGMDRRSWYMPKESADALARALHEIHFATEQPKHAIMAALVAVALDHLDEVREQLGAE